MKKIWTASYEGNTIKIENTWFNGVRLYVNGRLQDHRVGVVFSSKLTGHLFNAKNEREQIKASVDGWFTISCKLFIDDKEIALTRG